MARTPAQRGPFGRWLKQVREDRYETQAQAVAELRRLAGLAISPSEFAQWESGSRVPRDDNPKVARLYEFFGSRPETGLERPETPDSLVEAIRAQTAAISELVKVLGQARDFDVRIAALEGAVRLQARTSGGGLPAPALPLVGEESAR